MKMCHTDPGAALYNEYHIFLADYHNISTSDNPVYLIKLEISFFLFN